MSKNKNAWLFIGSLVSRQIKMLKHFQMKECYKNGKLNFIIMIFSSPVLVCSSVTDFDLQKQRNYFCFHLRIYRKQKNTNRRLLKGRHNCF